MTSTRTSDLTTPAGVRTWQEIICLLYEAANRGHQASEANPAVGSTASAAHIAAMSAVDILSPEQREGVDDVQLDEATTTMTFLELLHAAEEATRRHSIEQYPLGCSRIIIEIYDLIREVAP